MSYAALGIAIPLRDKNIVARRQTGARPGFGIAIPLRRRSVRGFGQDAPEQQPPSQQDWWTQAQQWGQQQWQSYQQGQQPSAPSGPLPPAAPAEPPSQPLPPGSSEIIQPDESIGYAVAAGIGIVGLVALYFILRK